MKRLKYKLDTSQIWKIVLRDLVVNLLSAGVALPFTFTTEEVKGCAF
jgi:hypothetical protein